MDTNMLAEMFEAVWGAQFIDSRGNYARECHPLLLLCMPERAPAHSSVSMNLQPDPGCACAAYLIITLFGAELLLLLSSKMGTHPGVHLLLLANTSLCNHWEDIT